MDYGTKALNDVLKKVDKMTLDEYEELYQQATENKDIIFEDYFSWADIMINYLKSQFTNNAKKNYEEKIDCNNIYFDAEENTRKIEENAFSLVA